MNDHISKTVFADEFHSATCFFGNRFLRIRLRKIVMDDGGGKFAVGLYNISQIAAVDEVAEAVAVGRNH